MVGGRTCTKLVDGVLGQVDLVRDALDDPTVPVVGVLCFVGAEWPLIGGAFRTRGVHVLWPKRLGRLLTEADSRTTEAPALDVESLRDRLARHFPPA